MTTITKTTNGADGTSLQGYVDATYAELVALFGKHQLNDGYKTDAEWVLQTPAGIATIYNYKTGRNYMGKNGQAIKNITDWHIGGKDKHIIPFILTAVEAYRIGHAL